MADYTPRIGDLIAGQVAQDTGSQIAPNILTRNVANYGFPTINSASTSDSNAANGVLGAATTAPTDPYAAYGGRAAYGNLVSSFNTQKQNIINTSSDAASNTAIGLHGSILDFLDSLRSGQQNIDTSATNNELAKTRGTASVFGDVSRGIQSGGVMLSNKNASDSSAAEGIARAYGQIGQRALSDVNNKYVLANEGIVQDQSNFDIQRASGLRKINDTKLQAVNGIVSDARNQLASLDAAIAKASLPQRIQIEQQKEQIRQSVLATLSQYDTELNQGVAGVAPSSQEARIAKATQLNTAGAALPSAFNYTSNVPTAVAGTGPFPSALPIFTLPNSKKATA